jgi:hypothetical protein
MEALNVEIINPKAKTLLEDLELIGLIRIKSEISLSEMLMRPPRNESEEEEDIVIHGVPRTIEELEASVAQAEEEYEKGLGFTQEEVFKKYEKWL